MGSELLAPRSSRWCAITSNVRILLNHPPATLGGHMRVESALPEVNLSLRRQKAAVRSRVFAVCAFRRTTALLVRKVFWPETERGEISAGAPKEENRPFHANTRLLLNYILQAIKHCISRESDWFDCSCCVKGLYKAVYLMWRMMKFGDKKTIEHLFFEIRKSIFRPKKVVRNNIIKSTCVYWMQIVGDIEPNLLLQ